MYSDSLSLDHYYVQEHTQIKAKEKQPCMIFMFGGGFFTGSKDDARYLKYYKTLAENGIQVFAIDYRLGLKPLVDNLKTKSTTQQPLKAKEMIALLESSINMAVEDLYKATSYILDSSDKWNIDKTKIMASGSSAGAISVLQAEYYMCNNHPDGRVDYTEFLPEDFKYAGIISFAGAILNLHKKMVWEKQPAPIQLFHGDADSNVPYDRIWTPLGCFNGSKYIAKKLSKMESPHYFYSIDNATHTIATTPMRHNLLQILDFISKFVIKGEQLIINLSETAPNAAEPKKNLRIKDYINANFK